MNVDELMERAFACAADGDFEGELEAYRQADELGDAEASILLGNALRRLGQIDLARAAYERADSRGHREGAMSLGNLLSDLGDTEGAKVAYLRAIQLGSTMASLNLGLMLAEAGSHDEALLHLGSAAEADDPAAFWGIGKVHEEARDLQAAADAYRRGSELGDAACAYALGGCLFELGDPAGARAAFERAVELGHDGAADVLAALDGVGVDGPQLGKLWSDVTAVYGALAAQRQELGRSWIAATLAIQEQQAKLEVLKSAHADVLQRFTTVTRRFNTEPERESLPSLARPLSTGPSPSDWLTLIPGRAGSWRLRDAHSRAVDADLDEARKALSQAEEKTFGGRLRQRGRDALERVAVRLDELAAAITVAAKDVMDAERAREAATQTSELRALEAMEPILTRAKSAASRLPAVLQPWDSPAWDSWHPNDATNLGVRVAYGGVLVPKPDERLGANAAFGTEVQIPWGFALHESWYVVHDGPSRAPAHAFARSMMLRNLLTVQPGELRFCIFDPIGLGQSAGEMLDLAEYDADLIGGKVWSSARDLEARLAELGSHIELVIQKYLRTMYQTIDEFNDAAGEVAEPYRVLVLFDFPTGLSNESAGLLKSIIENGPRCGVFTLIVADAAVQAPYGVDIGQFHSAMRTLNLQGDFSDEIDGYQLETSFEHDVLPERSGVARRIIDAVGRASISRTEAAVTFDKVFEMYGHVVARGLRPELDEAVTRTEASDPTTWWRGDSTRGLFAPIGQKGARDVAILGFDSSDRAGGLLVGRPGSGKSTLLHAYIGALTTLYGPEELELYLIDFKEGVEFKGYAQEQLPHAKVVAIESDREFGLSVLESLQSEITRRAELLRATGGRQSGMQGLRESTGEKIARILLVFDEFQVLFSRNDAVGLAAADLLESIIRQGRGFGVHVLLGSQSLAGLDALGAHVPQLLPVRILLPATETDARKVLGENNSGGDYLTTHGEGILNSAGGAVEANERFKGALLTEADRVARLQLMRQKANQIGFGRVPMVFEGNSLVPLSTEEPRRFWEELTAYGTYPLRIRSGVPMTVGDLGDVVISREGGANVLAIVRSGDGEIGTLEAAVGPAYGLLTAAVSSGITSNSTVDVIDFMSNDDGLDALFEPLLDAKRITLKRRRAFGDVVEAYRVEVRERVELDDVGRPAKLLFLFGIHRARELDSEFGSLDADSDLVEMLEQVMRDGPDVGVHVWMWSDSVAGASRRLTARMMREISWRIVGKMNSDDSRTVIGSGQAADLRESQLLIVNEDRGVSTRVTAYAPPSAAWVSEVAAVARSNGGANHA